MKKIVKILIFIVILTCIGGLIYFKVIKKEEKTEYITTFVERGDIVNSVVASGEVYAQDLVDVGAQVGGQIKKLYVNVGDFVKKGDLIAQIDSVKQENEIAQQKAQLKIYEANLASTKILAQNAKTQYKRELNLFRVNATSKENVENAKNQAALQEATLKQIQAQIEQTKIQLSTAQTNLGYTKISAPLDGTIVSIPVQEGKTVNANQTTPTIVKIADLTKMEIRMEIAEGDITKIKKGMKVQYSILSDLNHKRDASITSIDPALTTLSDGSYDKTSVSSSASNSNAVYFYAKVLVDNKDNYLKIGMTTENTIIIKESKDVLYIPTSAVKKEKDKMYAIVLDGENPNKKYITTGINDNANTEIKEGLKENDKVVIYQSNSEDAKNSHLKPDDLPE